MNATDRQYVTDLEGAANVQAKACARLVAAGMYQQARKHADRYLEITQRIERMLEADEAEVAS